MVFLNFSTLAASQRKKRRRINEEMEKIFQEAGLKSSQTSFLANPHASKGFINVETDADSIQSASSDSDLNSTFGDDFETDYATPTPRKKLDVNKTNKIDELQQIFPNEYAFVDVADVESSKDIEFVDKIQQLLRVRC